jgi:curved DNA-binding protein CbpA
MVTPYEVLGVAETATNAEIVGAFRRCTREHHPDLNGGTPEANAQMRVINAAFDALKTRQARAQTDAWLREARLEVERATVPGAPPAPPTNPAVTKARVWIDAGFDLLRAGAVVYDVLAKPSRASRPKARARSAPRAATQDPRCKAARFIDGRRCSNLALAGNYGFCGVHRR